MFFLSEQLALASKAVLDARLVSAHAFAEAAFESGVTLIDLNVDTLKSSLAAATVVTRQWMAAKNPQEWFGAGATLSQMAMERAGAYGRQAGDIAHNAQAMWSGVAQQEIAISKQKVSELVDIVKKTPTAVATPINSFLKSAFVNAHEAYDKTTTHTGQLAPVEVALADAAAARQRGAN